MSLLATKTHTVGNARRWYVDYSKWLPEGTWVASATVVSSSTSCTINNVALVENKKVVFFTNGGTLGETMTATITMTTSYSAIKIDTMQFLVVAP